MLEAGFYCMDCMDAMKQFPDGFFDLAVVDPPYGINADKRDFGSGASKDKAKYGTAARLRKTRLEHGCGTLKGRILNRSSCGWDSEIPPDSYFVELRRVSRNQCIWGGKLLPFTTNTRHCGMGQGPAVGKFQPGGNMLDEL